MKRILKNLSKAIIIFIVLSSQCLFSKNAENAITTQPFGLFFIRTNIEYERLITNLNDLGFSLCGRINISTQKIGLNSDFASNFTLNNAEFPSTWAGIGASARLYLEKEMEGLYIGLNLDNLNGENINSSAKVNANVFWFGLESGCKFVFGKKGKGVIVTPSASFILPIKYSNDNAKDMIGLFYSLGIA